MAFLAPLAASIGIGGVSTSAAAIGGFAAGGYTAAGVASAAATGAAAAQAATALSLGSLFAGGSTLWSALGAGFSALSSIGQIMSNSAAASAAMASTQLQIEGSALERARMRRDLERDRNTAAARRAAVLSATGGLQDGSDLIQEVLFEGSMESVRRDTDLSFQEGILTRRMANIQRGTARSNLGALAAGGARIAGFLR